MILFSEAAMLSAAQRTGTRALTTKSSGLLVAVVVMLTVLSMPTCTSAAPTSPTTYNLQRADSTVQDEDVIALDNLKKTHDDSAEEQLLQQQQSDILPALQRQLALGIADSTAPLNLGQREDEEQLIVHSTTNNKEEKEDGGGGGDTSGSADTAPVLKSFHGAARLTFGQNAEPVAIAAMTTTSPTIQTAAAVSTNSTPLSPHPTPAVAIIVAPHRTDEPPANNLPVPAVGPLTSSARSLSEITNNGQRRSATASDFSRKPNNKSPEMLLIRHSGGQVSSLDMAQYVFWTGDEEGVARAVEEFIQKGLMSRENAIKLLREISMGIEYLEHSYSNRVMQADQISDNGLAPTMRQSMSASPMTSTMTATTTTTTTTTTTPKPVPEHKIFQTKQTISPAVQKAIHNLPTYFKFNEIAKKNHDKGTPSSLHVDENSIGYEDVNDKLRLADCLYAAYSLEETIYQLAKVMFFQSLTTGSQQAQIALQRLTTFLETEGTEGRVSPVLQKRILDVLLAALSDCLAEHPDLLPAARDGLGAALDQLPKPRNAGAPISQHLIK